jgi:hypothetical protein
MITFSRWPGWLCLANVPFMLLQRHWWLAAFAFVAGAGCLLHAYRVRTILGVRLPWVRDDA